jgi:hypothetical protein
MVDPFEDSFHRRTVFDVELRCPSLEYRAISRRCWPVSARFSAGSAFGLATFLLPGGSAKER